MDLKSDLQLLGPRISQEVASMDRINGFFHLLINRVFVRVIGYNPLILTSWDIQVLKLWPKWRIKGVSNYLLTWMILQVPLITYDWGEIIR